MLAFPVDATGRSRVSFWRECLAPYQHAFCTLLREEVTAGRMAIDDIEADSTQFFNLVAAEPFIRNLLTDHGGTTPQAGRPNAAGTLLLQENCPRSRHQCYACNPAYQHLTTHHSTTTNKHARHQHRP